MPTYVSLFRGINVGGHHKVRMDELKALHEGLGFKEVVTYIQSGNVIFTSDDVDVAPLSRQIEDEFAQKFGFQVKVMVRTAATLEEIVTNNPFQIQPMKEVKRVHVLLLETRLERLALEAFQKIYDGPEELYLIDQEIYIYYPDGMGRSKLASTVLEKKLKILYHAYRQSMRQSIAVEQILNKPLSCLVVLLPLPDLAHPRPLPLLPTCSPGALDRLLLESNIWCEQS